METLPFEATQVADIFSEDPNMGSNLGPKQDSDSEVKHAKTLPKPIPSENVSPAATPKDKIGTSRPSTPTTLEMILAQKVPPGMLGCFVWMVS